MTATPATTSPMPRRAALAAVAVLAVAFVAIVPARGQAAPAFALVSQMGGKPTVLSRAQVRAIFSGRQAEWPGGQRIQLVLPPKGSLEMRWLCKEVLGMPEEVYRKYLLQKIFRGELKKPLGARTTAEMVELVKANSAAIGPASAADLPSDLARFVPN